MILQKAVTPQLSAAYHDHDHDRVAGFVVPWGAVGHARTPRELITAHGLDFPGTPFSADMPHIDVLRFEGTANLLLEKATGGPDRATQNVTGGPFLDRPPFRGDGFVADPDHVIPLSWLPHRRVPAGAELHRISADGTSTYLAYFHSAAWGWIYADDIEAMRERQPRLVSRFVGGLARMDDGEVRIADLIDGGTRVIAVRQDEQAEADGWTPTTPMVWSRTIDVADVQEYFELDVRTRWNGLGYRVTDEYPTASGLQLSGSYTDHDADLAEGLQLVKIDAAVYEGELPGHLLEEATVRQTQLPEWPALPTA
jgi:hypothetical protein